MATRTTPNDIDGLEETASRAPRVIRVAKSEEGEARGEWAHLLRAVLLVILGTAMLGWLLT